MRAELTYFCEDEKSKEYFRQTRRIINRWWPGSCALDLADGIYDFSATFVLKGSKQVIVGGSGFIYNRHRIPGGVDGDEEACKIVNERSDEAKKAEIREMKTVSNY